MATTTTPPAVHDYEEDQSRGNAIGTWLKGQYALYILVALLLVATITRGSIFWGGTNLTNLLLQMSIIGVVVLAELIVVLTGFASIATAVEAIKLGACHYLPKPSNTDDIEAAFSKAGGDVSAPIANRPTSIKTLEWERINETLADTGFNISETARRLGLHRRTLARKLEKQRTP